MEEKVGRSFGRLVGATAGGGRARASGDQTDEVRSEERAAVGKGQGAALMYPGPDHEQPSLPSA